MTDPIAALKANQDAAKEKAYIICDDPIALKVVAAWCPGVVSRMDKIKKAPTADEIWAAHRIDYAKLATMTGLDHDTTEKTVDRLRMLGLIYPDGTVNKFGMDVVHRRLRRYLGIKEEKA